MGLDTLGNPVHCIAINTSISIKLIVAVKWHIVEAIWRVWIGVTEWPTVVATISNLRKLLWWVVVYVGWDNFTVVASAIVEGIGDVVSIIDSYPEVICVRQECQSFCIA